MTPLLRHGWQRGRRIAAHRRTRIIVVWLVVLLALYALLGFLALPWFAKPRIEQALADALQRPAEIGALYTNPFSLSARIDNLRVYAPDKSDVVIGVDEIYANVSITSLFRLAPVLDRLRVVHPYLKLVRGADRQYNFQDVIDRYVWQEDKPEQPPARYSLNNIEVIDGRIEFDDQLTKQKHEVAALRMGIPFLSSLPYETDILVHPALSATVNGAPLAVRGETKPFGETRESTLYIDLDRFALPPYFDYVPIPLRFKLARGALDARLAVRVVIRQAKLETLSVSGTAALHDLLLQQRDGEPLVALESLATDIGELDLVHRRAAIKTLRVKAPQAHVTRFRGGNLNLELLAPLESGQPAPAAKGAAQAEPFTFTVDDLDVAEGRVQLIDYAAPQTFKTALTGIRLSAKQIGNAGAQPGKFAASLQLDGQGRVATEGELALKPLAVDGRFDIADVQLKRFQPYVGPERELAAGALSGSGQYRVKPGDKAPDIQLSNVGATLRDVRINTPIGPDRWRAGLLTLKGADIDVGKRNVVVADVAGRDVAATVLHARDGAWYVTGLLTVAAHAAAEDTKKTKEAQAEPWTYTVKKIALAQASLSYEDRVPAKPVSLRATGIDIQLADVSNAKDAQPQLTLEATIEKGGRLSLSGPLSLAPFGANWAVNAKTIPIGPFQPYWADVLNARVTRGTVSTRGQLQIGAAAPSKAGVNYRGNVAVSNFAALDARTTRDLLRWRTLFLKDGLLQTEPMLIRVGAVSLRDFYSRLVVRPDGTLNVQQLAEKNTPAPADTAAAPGPAPTPPIAKEKPRIEIGDIRLRDGQLSFSDFYIKPNYSAEIAKLNGTIGAMTPERAGRIELSGEINETAPVTIAGLINPLAQSLFLDIDAGAKGVNLPPLSPYSVRYIGYPIERGKLSMSVHYHIENAELTAQNQLILNQLDFGEKVESPNALNVPVHLAVTLLKDRNGVIDLNVPISGSLNDPQFSIGGVIARAIGNLFLKAVTAPFAAIGAIFGGGGETLSYVEFEPGSAKLDDDDVGKLEHIAEALRERPALTLDIAGRIDPDKEQDALRQATLLRRLKSQKLKDVASSGGATPSLDDIELTPDEYNKYLERAYDAADFDKPRNFLGFAKSLPPAEMEKLLLQHINVSENAMRRLANDRAQAALEWLTQQGKVPAERVYIIAPRLNAEGIDDKGATTRVDFALR